MIDQLNDIQQQITESVADLERKVEEARQQEAWEEKRNKLLAEVRDLESRLTEHERTLSDKKTQYEQELAERKSQLELLLQEKGYTSTSFPKYKRELEEKAGKENRKKNFEEAHEAARELEKLNKLDPAGLTRTFENDSKRLENQRVSLENKLKQKKKELADLGDTFVPRKTDGSGSAIDSLKGTGKQSATQALAPLSIDFPEELPAVGRLFVLKNQRYLAIADWVDEDQGRKEAERLKAQLCATRN